MREAIALDDGSMYYVVVVILLSQFDDPSSVFSLFRFISNIIRIQIYAEIHCSRLWFAFHFFWLAHTIINCQQPG